MSGPPTNKESYSWDGRYFVLSFAQHVALGSGPQSLCCAPGGLSRLRQLPGREGHSVDVTLASGPTGLDLRGLPAIKTPRVPAA